MGWKNWPYWLRGGIIGGVIGIIWFVFHFMGMNFGPGEGGYLNWVYYTFGVISGLLGSILGFFIFPIALLFGEYFSDATATPFLIISVIYLFLIGALIGFIIGKIKSRNKKKRRVK